MSSQLNQALNQATLMTAMKVVKPIIKSRNQVAKRVFQLATSGGFPYTGQTYKQWAKKWLPSETFKLVEIDIHAAASAHLPKNPERVAYKLLCSQDSLDPIVVDLNKVGIGQSHLGYIPDVIVVDGKHHKQSAVLQGHTKILAWVGCKAEKRIKNVKVIDKLNFSTVKPPNGKVIIQASALTIARHDPLTTAYNLHCATVPATGQAIMDQSGGEGGSRPRSAMVKAKKNGKMKSAGGGASGMGMGPGLSNQGGSGSNPMTMRSAKKVEECGACGDSPMSMGHLEDPSASDSSGDVPSASDQTSHVSASDQRQYKYPDQQIKAPGAKGWQGFHDNPAQQSPGSGVGPRVKRDTGATRSEMSRLADTVGEVKAKGIKSKGKIIDEIHNVAPPGMEDLVMKLKKQYGEDSSTPFRVAWSQYNKGKGA